MAIKRYDTKVDDDNDNVYWYRNKLITLPIEETKYLKTKWNDMYSLFRLSYIMYDDTSLYWLILVANKINNPHIFKNGDELRILKKEYIKEII